jgi:serine O-acetyltransferase
MDEMGQERPAGFVERLLRAQSRPVVGPLARQCALLLGVDVPPSVVIGEDLRLQHRGRGIVLHPRTTIGDRVRIFHNVTVGRAEPHSLRPDDAIERFVIEDDAWLCVGAVVLGSSGVVRIGRGTVVAANAVVLGSTGEDEIWAGAPARKVADRPEPRRNR